MSQADSSPNSPEPTSHSTNDPAELMRQAQSGLEALKTAKQQPGYQQTPEEAEVERDFFRGIANSMLEIAKAHGNTELEASAKALLARLGS